MEFREAITDAIRYWERRRLIYNAVLAFVVLAVALPWIPRLGWREWIVGGVWLFILAVIANILYCAAYVVDVVVQLSDFRAAWLRFRWMLFAIGMALAVLLELMTLAGFWAPLGNW